MTTLKEKLTRSGWLWLGLILLLGWASNFSAAARSDDQAVSLKAPQTEIVSGIDGPAELDIRYLAVNELKPKAPGSMRIGSMAAAEPQADIIFIHGHAGRLDNHGLLFSTWAEAGYRVISFDLPSHGESQILPIDLYSFEELFALIRLVDEATLEDPDRPLFIAGWSFGGLVATRLAQQPDLLASLSRTPQGMILLAPGIIVYPFTGGDGISRVRTLSNNPNPPLAGPPSPASPLQNPVFAVRLLAEAWLGERAPLPASLPVLVLAADNDDDWYVNEAAVLAWTESQRRQGADIRTFQCPQAKHALDNEPYPIGPTVRQLTVDFITATLQGTRIEGVDWLANVPDGPACILQ
jgi:alpha-beta hydrolase superfamily lysophospholipase